MSFSFLNKLQLLFGLDINYFIKGGFWIFLSMASIAGGGILLSAMFSRVWPADVYGELVFLNTAISFISLTAMPGLNQVVTHEVARGRDGTYLHSLKLSLKWSFLGLAILILGAFYFLLRDNTDLGIAFLIHALVFPLSYGLNLYPAILNGKKDFKSLALFTSLAQFGSIITTFLVLWFIPNFIFVVIASAFSTALINLVLTFLSMRWIKNNKKDMHAINFGIKLSFSSLIFLSVDYLDRFLVPVLIGFTANAVYAFATLIPIQLHNLLKMFTTLGQPKIATLNKKGARRAIIQKSLQLEILIFILVVLYILSAPYIFSILYPKYQSIATLPSQLFVLTLLYFPSNLFGIATTGEKPTEYIYKYNIIYAVAVILPLVILTPIFGLYGVIYSKIISRVTQVVFQIYIFNRYFP